MGRLSPALLLLLATAAICTAAVPLTTYDTLWMTVWDHEFTTPDFQCRGNNPPVPCSSGDPVVDTLLAADNKPASQASNGNPRVHDWFTKGVEYCRTLIFRRDTADSRILVYPPSDTQNFFFPIDGVTSNSIASSPDGQKHNFAFCDETHGVFKYRGGEKFEFAGDDDLFLFINGRLAVDMGGCHAPLTRILELDKRAKVPGKAVDQFGELRGRVLPALDLDTGKYYAFDLYHCERNTNVSTFKIRMSIDVKPPLPPDYYIGSDERTMYKSTDTITVDKRVGPATLFAFLSKDDSRQSNCKTVTVGTINGIRATWKLDGVTKSSDSLIRIDPLDLAVGTYTLTMQSDTVVRQVLVKIVGITTVEDVVATPPDTTFSPSLSVRLSTPTEGASIHYTLDSSEPTEQSPLYIVPLNLTQTTTIKARAFKSGSVSSGISTFSYTRLVQITGGYYKDLNADGYIETAVIQLDIDAALPSTLTLKDPFTGVQHAIGANSIGKLTTQQGIHFSPNAVVVSFAPFAFGTSFSAAALGAITGQSGFATGTFEIADSVAPVAREAEYRPGSITDPVAGTRAPDTLLVKFSEPVTMTSPADTIRPFVFTQNSNRYTMALSSNASDGQEIAYTVYAVEGVSFPRNNDSLRLEPGEIAGADSRIQDNPDNRPVPLRVLPPPMLFVQRVLTPFKAGPNGTDIPTQIREAIAQDRQLPSDARDRMLTVTKGTVVMTKPVAPNPDQTYGVRGHVSLFDAVGNKVIDDESMAIDNKQNLIWVWDGRNRSGRYAGSGSYLAVVTHEELQNGAVVRRTVSKALIGMRR